MSKYNGWENRATWLVGLHFGEVIKEDLQEKADRGDIDKDTSMDDIAEGIQNIVDEFTRLEGIDELGGFLSDMLDLSVIDYYELAETYKIDINFLEEE